MNINLLIVGFAVAKTIKLLGRKDRNYRQQQERGGRKEMKTGRQTDKRKKERKEQYE